MTNKEMIIAIATKVDNMVEEIATLKGITDEERTLPEETKNDITHILIDKLIQHQLQNENLDSELAAIIEEFPKVQMAAAVNPNMHSILTAIHYYAESALVVKDKGCKDCEKDCKFRDAYLRTSERALH